MTKFAEHYKCPCSAGLTNKGYIQSAEYNVHEYDFYCSNENCRYNYILYIINDKNSNIYLSRESIELEIDKYQIYIENNIKNKITTTSTIDDNYINVATSGMNLHKPIDKIIAMLHTMTLFS